MKKKYSHVNKCVNAFTGGLDETKIDIVSIQVVEKRTSLRTT